MSVQIPDNLLHRTFELIDRFLKRENIEFLRLPDVRRKFELGIQLDEGELFTWGDISRLVTTMGDTETIESLSRLNEKLKALIGESVRHITHPFFRDIPATEHRSFTVYDLQGGSIETSFPLRISRMPVRFDLSGFSLTGRGSVLDFQYGTNFWVIALKESLAWTSWLALRQNLADLGLVSGEVTLFENVSVVNANIRNLPDGPFRGFSFETVQDEDWVPLTDGEGEHLNDIVTELVGNETRMSLEAMANRLKKSGVTMSTWNDIRVNVRTGETRPGPTMRPILISAGMFLNAIRMQTELGSREPYFPDINTYATGNASLIASQNGLLGIIETLYTSTGHDFPSHVIMTKQAFDEFMKYIVTSGFTFLPDIAEMNQTEIMRIIDYYFENIGANGIVFFLIALLPAILTSTDPDEWLTVASGHINRASLHADDEGSLDRYWVNLSRNKELWGVEKSTHLERFVDRMIERKKGGGGQGSPPQGAAGGGGMGQAGGPIMTNSPGGVARSMMIPSTQALNISTMLMSSSLFMSASFRGAVMLRY